jgi:hypothetical protein
MKTLLSMPPYNTFIWNHFNIAFWISRTSALLTSVTTFVIPSAAIHSTTLSPNPRPTTTAGRHCRPYHLVVLARHGSRLSKPLPAIRDLLPMRTNLLRHRTPGATRKPLEIHPLQYLHLRHDSSLLLVSAHLVQRANRSKFIPCNTFTCATTPLCCSSPHSSNV